MLQIRSFFILCMLLVVASRPAFPQIPSSDTETKASNKACLHVGIFSDFGKVATSVAIPILERMYSLAGLCMKPVYMPSNRSMRQLMSGVLDAEMVRAPAAIVHMNKQAVLVPQAMVNVSIQFTWVDGLDFDGTLKGLKGKSVGILSGMSTQRQQLAHYTDKITQLQNLNSVGDLLERGRIDVLISGGMAYFRLRDKLAAKGIQLHAKVFLQVPAYHALHVRHADKTKRLAAALKAMITNGEFAKFNPKLGLLPAAIEP